MRPVTTAETSDSAAYADPRLRSPGYRGKRALDLVLTLGTAILWVPLVLIVALITRIAMGTPVLFRQQRPGLGAVPFTLLKFRTMRDAVGPDGRSLPDAARLTRFGQWLRTTSLDELPELINVVRGNMSLVGPRPLLMQYLPLYSERHRRRHLVRPGLTGLAQVSGRNHLSWERRLDLDVEYVDSMSLAKDVKILIATLRTTLNGHGISAPGEATMSPFTGYDTSDSGHPGTR
jgi:lipopolysaccharide/colanic/teichoic acid biosynthesis glycosyltransferase